MKINAFGASAASGGWLSDDKYPRELADINGDNRADIVGFGDDGVYVSLANADGSFGSPYLAEASFGASAAAGGWTSENLLPRFAADVNGDGKADLVGFGNAGVYVALSKGDGFFQPVEFDLANFGHDASAGSWTSQDKYPRVLADVNGDGAADVVGFGDAGVSISLSDFHVL